MELLKSVGIDVSRSFICVCSISEEPEDLKEFSESYKPTFLKPDGEGVDQLLSMGGPYFLEPTGADYWFWVDVLIAAGLDHYFVSGSRIRNYARTHEILSKGDKEDAAVIAAYGLENLRKGKMSAFLDIPRTALKEHWLTLRTLPKISAQFQNKIKARLAFEAPHLAKVTPHDRPWGNESAPALWRELAGLPVQAGGRKRKDPPNPVGRSPGWITEGLASLLCLHEQLQARVEQAIDQEIEKDNTRSMAVFQEVFKAWGITTRTGVAILSAAHPFEQFLSEDGKRLRRRKWNQSGDKRSGRDKSLKAFQRALAFGQIKIQSGQKMAQIPTGDRYVRDAIINFLVAKVVTARQPTAARLHKLYGKPEGWAGWSKKQRQEWTEKYKFEGLFKGYGSEPWNNPDAIAAVMQYNKSTEPFARLQLFYQYAPQCQNLSKYTRIKKVYSKFVRMLFKDLFAAYQTAAPRSD